MRQENQINNYEDDLPNTNTTTTNNNIFIQESFKVEHLKTYVINTPNTEKQDSRIWIAFIKPNYIKNFIDQISTKMLLASNESHKLGSFWIITESKI